MKTITSRFAAALALTGVCCFAPASLICAIEATNPQGSPDNYYLVPDLAALTAQQNRISDMAGAGELNQSAIASFNTHGAAVNSIPQIVGHPLPIPRPVPGQPFPNRPVHPGNPLRPAPAGVRYLGTDGTSQTLEVDGVFPAGTQLELNCGKHIVPQFPQETTVSATQINLKIPNNLIDRACYVSTKAAPTVHVYDFTLPGLSCATLASLCPGQVLDTFDTKTSDGKNVHIEIRNGTAPGAVFTDDVVQQIKHFLATVPPDNLKDVKFIQSSGPDTSNSDLIVDSYARAANGGGIFLGIRSPAFQDIANDVANGVASQIFAHLSTQDKAEYDMHGVISYDGASQPEDIFDLSYSDWYKSETYSLFQMIFAAEDPSTSPALRAAYLKLVLSMSAQFYNAATNEIATFTNGPRAPRTGLVTVKFSGNTLQIIDKILGYKI